MKAVVVIDGEEIKVEGKDLTIVTNIMLNELYVLDRESDRYIFSCHQSMVDYAYIVPEGDAE